MATDHYHSFTLLKKEIQQHAAYKLGITKALADWSLQDIRDFQTDLEAVCKSAVSEKWVYTHFKNQSEKLPRIDVLNLLTAWIGYKNWDEFLRKHTTEKPKQNKTRAGVVGFTGILLLVGFAWMVFPRKAHMVIVFKDAYTRKSIEIHELTLKINNQSMATASISSDLLGDTLVADGPYYKQKKVRIPTDLGDTLMVELLPDDYALMLNFFSRSAADDLEKRRVQLMEAIHPEAKIFQSHPQFDGIELLNREEFMERLILPINSLKNLEIQHIIYKDEKIYRLQFLQKPDDSEIN